MKKGVEGAYAPKSKPMKILRESDRSIDYGSLVILGGVYPLSHDVRGAELPIRDVNVRRF